MAELVDKGILKLDFVEKGQQSKRYKIGEKWELNWDEICEVIDGAQTIDAEPVIRCKDCKYYRDGDCWHEWDNDGQIYYQSVINEPNPDDYCSRAERREE